MTKVCSVLWVSACILLCAGCALEGPVEYRIAYNANGGSGVMEDSSHALSLTKNLNPNGFSREGYTFTGWAASPEGLVVYADQAPVLDVASPGAVFTLYAKWNAIMYTISFYLTGGTGDDTPKNYTVETPDILLPQPSRDAYTFAGWYDNPAYTGTQISSIPAGSTGDLALYAKWARLTYQIEYNANGGAGAMDNTIHIYDEAQNLRANTFTRAGYVFTGWAKTANGQVEYTDGQNVSNLANINGAVITLYAQWNILTYTISFYLTGGTGDDTPKNYTVETPDILLPQPSRDTYTFAGWYDNLAYTGTQISSIPAGSTGNLALYAKWARLTYRVAYNANGGASTMDNTIHIYDEAQNLRANTFTRAGYVFTGWAKTANGQVEYTDGQSVLNLANINGEVITLYAQWNIITYTISFYLTGGTGDDTPKNYTVETPDILLSQPSRDTYTFAGWYDNPAYTGTQISSIPAGSTGNLALYAKWARLTYRVAYNANGGAGTMDNTIHIYDEAQNLRANTFTRAGYVFTGWAESASGPVVYADGQSVLNLSSSNGATTTLYAKWEVITYRIGYNANNGTGGMEDSAHTYGVAKNLNVNSFTRTGYTFAGWAESLSGPVVYKDGQNVLNLSETNGAAITLYAKWEAITYRIKYNANGGTGDMTDSSHIYGVAKNLSANTFTWTGYTFSGWATSAGGQMVHADQANVTNLTATADAVVTLYAIWEAIPAPGDVTGLNAVRSRYSTYTDKWGLSTYNKIELTWLRPANAVSYIIICGDRTYTTSDTSYTIQTLGTSATYTVTVKAVNANGVSSMGVSKTLGPLP